MKTEKIQKLLNLVDEDVIDSLLSSAAKQRIGVIDDKLADLTNERATLVKLTNGKSDAGVIHAPQMLPRAKEPTMPAAPRPIAPGVKHKKRPVRPAPNPANIYSSYVDAYRALVSFILEHVGGLYVGKSNLSQDERKRAIARVKIERVGQVVTGGWTSAPLRVDLYEEKILHILDRISVEHLARLGKEGLLKVRPSALTRKHYAMFLNYKAEGKVPRRCLSVLLDGSDKRAVLQFFGVYEPRK